MWMGILVGGFCWFDFKIEVFWFFQVDLDDEMFILNNNIFGFDIDQDGNIWMVINGGGIFIFFVSEKSKFNFKFEILEILAGICLFFIMVDSCNCFWIGVIDGSIIKGYINWKDFKFFKIEWEYDCVGLGDLLQWGNFIYDIVEDEVGNVWVVIIWYGVKKISFGSLEMQYCGFVNFGLFCVLENYIVFLEVYLDGFLLLGMERGGY